MVELEHEPDGAVAQRRELARWHAHRRELFAGDARSCPRVGMSSVPMQWSSVLLPAPDGPTMATTSPSSIVEVDAAQHLELAPHVLERLVDVLR